MAPNERLAELSRAGGAVWLDDLSRDRIRSGGLQSLADDYSVVGVTTNPTIFAAGVKNPDYPVTLYVSGLIAQDTVNTMPEETLKAYAGHGISGTSVAQAYDEAAQVMKAIAEAGVDLDDVFQVLEDEGVQKFTGSWDELTDSVRSELEDKQ